jgi:xanthine dehydrogenase YagR molybdenum-binding subunit
MGTAVYPGHRSKSSAKVRLQADGTAQVSLATEDLGTGMWTVVAIVGAQSLGLPIVKLDKLLVPFTPRIRSSHRIAGNTMRRRNEPRRLKP